MLYSDPRTLIVGISASLGAGAIAKGARQLNAQTAETCLRYLALHDRLLTLTDEWGALEGWLYRNHPGFAHMSEDEQAEVPQAARLPEIDREREGIQAEAKTLLPVILKLRCRAPQAMMARLMIIERLVPEDENEVANTLLRASLEDFGRLLSVRTWIWTSPWPQVPGVQGSTYEPS